MIYSLNEARNVEEYRAEKAAREKAENEQKDKQYGDRYYGKNKKDFLGFFTQKTRADGHSDFYRTDEAGSRNRGGRVVRGSDKYYGPDNKDMTRKYDAERVAGRNDKSGVDFTEFSDAANRNMRRHPERWDGDKPVKPKSESTIFDTIEIV